MKRSLIVSMILGSALTAQAQPITATLMLKEQVPMEELAQNVLDEDSDRYQDYYSPEEIRKLVAPSDEDYNTLLKNLKKEGFSIIFASRSHLNLVIKGESSDFEHVFNTRIQFTENGQYQALTQALIPDHLGIVASVSGLNTQHPFKPLYKKIIHHNAFNEQPGILPDQIKKAYGFDDIYDTGITGRGQHIAIATYMDFILDDVTQYYDLIRLSPRPSVDKVLFNGTPRYDADSAGETELDSELSGMIAPGAKIHVFTSAENSANGELALITAILDDNRSKVVNYSWGLCETYIEADHRQDMDKVYARAVAQGVNLLVASGDSGSDGCDDGGKVADWPALHPNVVAVGGTSLTINSDGSKRERAWSGSGGGVSAVYELPKWQEGFKSPFVRRSFPDIAFNADPGTGEGIWVRSSPTSAPYWVQVGGTSMSAPQWAGFLALVNEARTDRGLKPIGFLNPILYKASAIENKEIFTDITSGKNGAYTAVKGWDAVTGLGSMKGYAMFQFLLNR